MTSPFPGMDPYLEGYLWPDVHNRLAAVISELLAPQIAPKYVARLELYTVDDSSPESEIGIMYPDVEILKRNTLLKESDVAYGAVNSITEPTVVIAANQAIRLNIPVVEIRDVAKNRLVTAIEILYPVNKRKPGLDAYQEKRMDLHRSGVHLLEIDLLRRGTRPFLHPRLPQADYLALLMRAGTQKTEVWAFNLPDALPVLPVPLAHPDADVKLSLRQALDLIYERSLYQLSIDYQKDPPPPEFSAAVKTWMQEVANKTE
ncbi:DUF4058 family protein [Haliscomenobacter hydrossis]|uniref:DUF4058 domain-containing protein n=1 Tax=Haliscomenobacter hydrossis (strain ATCC 27775 / DSM 1100 / LMG 10767 / O) TaxID=760192 RepID=F4L0P2_HALH1|nr:DUF4058 family protein [Haliscomenobacter hydrossis]AEE49524.1 hypothetical protein Halhy_1634 [Haliscomenobacter hydrossis DSM 1100]